MANNYFKLRRCEEEANEDLDRSKLLGAPVMPEGFFEKLGLSESDYFIAQINCSELPDHTYAPEKGWVYLFLDIDTLQPKAFYTAEEPAELLSEINANFDEESCGETVAHYLDFVEESEAFVFGPKDKDLDLQAYADTEGKVTLLQIDALALGDSKLFQFTDLAVGDGYLIFLIDKKKLAKGDFSEVSFIDYGY
ncbi:MAG: DUF1963 domain-containing protein [Bacilli bacterium]|nr:DUF1963 domain-containing protein [Bacilli bacterium]